MAFLLDSDTFTLFQNRHPLVVRRVAEQNAQGVSVYLSAVVVGEAVKGALALVTQRQGRANADIEAAYDLLLTVLREVSRFPLLPHDAEAEQHFQTFAASVRRVGTNDCRVAASAIIHDFTVVTCNTRDYERIPGVRFVDWSVDGN